MQETTNWTTILFLFGIAIPFGWDAVKETGWRRWGAAGLAVLFALAALLWGVIEVNLPIVAAFVSGLAQSPQVWFTLFVLVAAIAIFSGPNFGWTGNSSELRRSFLELESKDGTTDQDILTFIHSLSEKVDELSGHLERAEQKLHEIQNSKIPDIEAVLRPEQKGLATLLTAPPLSRFEQIEAELDELDGRVQNIVSDLGKLTDAFPEVNWDLARLFSFAVDETTVALLDKLIAEAPIDPVPLEGDGDAREDIYKQAVQYVRKLNGRFGGHHRSATIRNIIAAAEGEAEKIVQDLALSRNIPSAKIIELRRYKIAEVQCQRIKNYLEHERAEVLARAVSMRDDLIERMSRRNGT